MSVDVTTNNDDSSTASLSVEQRRRSDRRRWWYTSILVPVLLLVLMFGVLAVALILHRQQSDRPTPDPEPDESAFDANLSSIDLELRHATFDVEFAQAKQGLRHLESAQSEWSKLLETTLHDTVGKRIAGNEELLLQFMALRRMSPPLATAPLAPDIATKLSGVRAKAKSPDADGDILDGTKTEAERIKQDFVNAYKFFHSRVSHLHALRESAASLPAGDLELVEVISARNTARANKVRAAAEATTHAVGASLDSELKRLKKQRDDAAGLVADLESLLSRVEKGESLNTPTGSDVSPTLASREDYERELAQIRTDLVAFTTPGYVQPESADKLVYHKAKQPFSFSALQRIGALEDSPAGRAILLRVGGSKSATQQNDRPLGNFPRMNSISELSKPPDAVVARLKETQRLLRQYGQLMVEDGLLSP